MFNRLCSAGEAQLFFLQPVNCDEQSWFKRRDGGEGDLFPFPFIFEHIALFFLQYPVQAVQERPNMVTFSKMEKTENQSNTQSASCQ